MKVAFWSNTSRGGVTTNLVTVAAVMAQIYRMKIVMVSNHFEEHSLGYTALGREYDSLVNEACKYYSCGDTRFNVRKIVSPICTEPLNGASFDGIEDGLYYYLQERMYSNSLNEVNFNGEFNELVNKLEKDFDFVFMDLQSKGSLNTLQQLESADLVVVNLKQDKELIRDFFKHYGSMKGKCIFFLSNYLDYGEYLKRNIVKEYIIHPERVAIIPNNKEFESCIIDGRIIPYVIMHLYCGKKNKQYRNIKKLKYAAEVLYNALTDRHYDGFGVGLSLPEVIAN